MVFSIHSSKQVSRRILEPLEVNTKIFRWGIATLLNHVIPNVFVLVSEKVVQHTLEGNIAMDYDSLDSPVINNRGL